MSEPTRSWKDVLAAEPVNEKRAEIYRRLMEAQDRIARARYRRGVSNEAVLAALDAADETLSDAERCEDLYLASLAHYVEALGGRLEVRAVFDGDHLVVRQLPD
jgi:hypothetical protein